MERRETLEVPVFFPDMRRGSAAAGTGSPQDKGGSTGRGGGFAYCGTHLNLMWVPSMLPTHPLIPNRSNQVARAASTSAGVGMRTSS